MEKLLAQEFSLCNSYISQTFVQTLSPTSLLQYENQELPNTVMQVTRIEIGQLPKLFHVQSNTYIDLPLNLTVIHIGKPNERIAPDIDVSNLPKSDVVSRVHARIYVEGNSYFIEDLGSANGTYLNQSLLSPLTRCQLNLGDRIDFGKEGSFTFLFQAIKNSSANSFAVPMVSSREESDEEFQVSFFTKILGLGLMLGGLGFLSSSIIIGSAGLIYNTPLVVLGIAGILTLNYGGSNRNLGWVLIGVGLAIAIASGGIAIVPMTLLSFLLATGSFSTGYQLFTAGKVFNYNPLALKQVFKK